mmetsp:Transcript_7336/g.23487  ORF Transcript_7336/g.23487 Transcript_7336/m.23487 type:complete len:502 (+) Transcript_7336:125-1630(+)
MMSWAASPQRKGKEAANAAMDAALTVNERILRDIAACYAEPGAGETAEPQLDPAALQPGKDKLMAICSKLGLSCIAPRRKINVMIVGNHSAGKSSYINWYCCEHVQTTAVAIETSGFSFCTSGKKRETLRGKATLQLFEHLRHDLKGFFPAIYPGLSTEVSTSKERCFNLVTFIDTPGLVDGSFHYPFPVEDIIVAMARHTDLIYVLFDPIGQALCDRTMNVIERLNEQHATKMRYFLSKADTVPLERDRQKVIVQITQNLSSRIRNKHAFELPSLYIPDKSSTGSESIDNNIERTCDEIESAVHQNVQNNLDKLGEDCQLIDETICSLLKQDDVARAHNRRAALYGYALLALSLQPLLFALAFALDKMALPPLGQLRLVAPQAHAIAIAVGVALVDSPPPAALALRPDSTADGADATEADRPSLGGAAGLLSLQQFLGGCAALFVALQLASLLVRRYRPAYSSRTRASLVATRSFVSSDLRERKARLYKSYLDQCSSGVS